MHAREMHACKVYACVRGARLRGICRRGCTSGRYTSGRCTSVRSSLPVNVYEVYGNFDFRDFRPISHRSHSSHSSHSRPGAKTGALPDQTGAPKPETEFPATTLQKLGKQSPESDFHDRFHPTVWVVRVWA